MIRMSALYFPIVPSFEVVHHEPFQMLTTVEHFLIPVFSVSDIPKDLLDELSSVYCFQ